MFRKTVRCSQSHTMVQQTLQRRAVQPASIGSVCSQQVQWTVLCTWYAASTSVRISRSHYNSHRSAAHMSRGCSAVTNARQGQQSAQANSTRHYSAIILQDSHMQSVPQGSMVTLKHRIVMKATKHSCNGLAPLINASKSKPEDSHLQPTGGGLRAGNCTRQSML